MRLVLPLLLLAPLVARAQLTPWPEPDPRESTRPVLCAERAGIRVCRSATDDGEFSFVAEGGGRLAASWRADGGLHTGFRVFDGDLDGDGGTELLVANLDGVSNGLGVAYWTVYVLPADALVPAYRFRSEEFGAGGGSFETWRGRPVVWATQWRGGPDPSGRRGDGLYLVGRPFVLGADGLEPATALPVRARRLLDSFERDDRGPVAWLSDRRAETRGTDPAVDGCRRTVERGTVRTAEDTVGDGATRYLLVTLDTGRRLSYGRVGGGDEPAEITYLGADGRLFPPGYRPSDLPYWLTGRAVRVETCADDDVRTRVLWLD